MYNTLPLYGHGKTRHTTQPHELNDAKAKETEPSVSARPHYFSIQLLLLLLPPQIWKLLAGEKDI